MRAYQSETIVIPFGIGVTSTNVDIKIMRLSDGFWRDFSVADVNDAAAFKDSGWTDKDGDMTSDDENVWKYSFTVPQAHEKYALIFLNVDTGYAYNGPLIEVYGGLIFTVQTDGGNSSTTFKTDLTQSVTDYFKSPSLIKFLDGNLAGQTSKLPSSGSYNGTTKFLTVSPALTATPDDDSKGLVINE